MKLNVLEQRGSFWKMEIINKALMGDKHRSESRCEIVCEVGGRGARSVLMQAEGPCFLK